MTSYAESVVLEELVASAAMNMSTQTFALTRASDNLVLLVEFWMYDPRPYVQDMSKVNEAMSEIWTGMVSFSTSFAFGNAWTGSSTGPGG